MDKIKSNLPEPHPKRFRVLGSDKGEIEASFKGLLKNHMPSLSPMQQDLIKRQEYPKSDIELAIIDLINKRTNEIIREAGGTPHDIPPDNIHILPENLCKDVMDDAAGKCQFTTQMILLSASKLRGNPQYFASVCFHEMMHLKAPMLAQVYRETIPEESESTEVYAETAEDLDSGSADDKKKYSSHPHIVRTGLSVFSTLRDDMENKSHSHFIGLHEAIIAYAHSKFNKEILGLPILKKEKEFLESEEVKNFVDREVTRYKLDTNEVLSVEPDLAHEGNYIIKWNNYMEHRRVLIYVMEEIMEMNKDKFENIDEVFKIFLKAQYSLNFGEIARLVESAFGGVSFRVFGDMGADATSGVKCLEAMRAMRANFKRQQRREKELIENAKREAIRELYHKDIDDTDPA